MHKPRGFFYWLPCGYNKESQLSSEWPSEALWSIPNLCLSLKYHSSAKNVLPTGYIIMNVYPASTWKKLLSEVEPNTITRSPKDLTVKLIS